MKHRLPFAPVMLLLACVLASPMVPLPALAQDGETLVYIGTFTGRGSEGIYAWRLDAATAEMQPVGLVAETGRPGFLALHPSRNYLFATGDSAVADNQRIPVVRSFAIDPVSARLTALNAVGSRGANPAHMGVDSAGRHVLVANYSGATVAVLPVGPDGRLREASDSVEHTGSSVHPERQTRAYPHSIDLSPDQRFALVADLGSDRLVVYRFDPERGTLTPNDPPFAALSAGAGPRHFVFHPSGEFVYVANELSSGVTVFRWDPGRGALTEVQTITTLPDGFSGQNTVSEVRVHPTGRFLYVANRGDDSIVLFSIDEADGTLTTVEWTPTGGRTPRNFGVDPSGRVLIAANQDSNSLVVFRIDAESGRLAPTGQSFDVSTPTYVLFVPRP